MIASEDRILRKKVDTAAGGTVAVIAAVAGQRIYVLALDLSLASSTTIKFQSAATDLTGAMTCTSKQLPPVPLNHGLVPWFLCGVNEALNIVFGAAVQCSGEILYMQY